MEAEILNGIFIIREEFTELPQGSIPTLEYSRCISAWRLKGGVPAWAATLLVLTFYSVFGLHGQALVVRDLQRWLL